MQEIAKTKMALTLAHGDAKTRVRVGQKPQRALEEATRRHVMEIDRWLRRHRLHDQKHSSMRLGLSTRTLRRWEKNWEMDRGRSPIPRGRPEDGADGETRRGFFATLWTFGLMKVEELKEIFSDLSRRVILSLKSCFVRVVTRLGRMGLNALRWTKVGAVWAMDYANSPQPMEGVFKKILVVTDLASGMKLLAQPQEEESSIGVELALKALFVEHGHPLVLKSDNGSSFASHGVQTFLEGEEVLWLPSPPGHLKYNGACEAGVGTIKTRAGRHAAFEGRAGDWTCDDLEWAREDANAVGRPRGMRRLTPNEAYARREAIAPSLRKTFRSAYRECHEREVATRRSSNCRDMNQQERLSIHRAAVARALLDHGLLTIRRSRLTPQMKSEKAVNIT